MKIHTIVNENENRNENSLIEKKRLKTIANIVEKNVKTGSTLCRIQQSVANQHILLIGLLAF